MAAKKKKKTSKKKSSSAAKRSANRTELKLHVNKGSAVDGGPAHIWHVHLKSSAGSVTAGAVVANTETDAKKKAKRLLRTLCA